MRRLSLWTFRLTYATTGAVVLAVLLGYLWRADFVAAAKLATPFLAGFYGTAILFYNRARPPVVSRQRRRAVYAAERTLQAFLLLAFGTALLFALGIIFSDAGIGRGIARSAWLAPVAAVPLLLVAGAYVAYFHALDVVARRFFSATKARRFLRALR